MIFFSADGNFEVTLATKATLFHNGLVEVRNNAETNTKIKKISIYKYICRNKYKYNNMNNNTNTLEIQLHYGLVKVTYNAEYKYKYKENHCSNTLTSKETNPNMRRLK